MPVAAIADIIVFSPAEIKLFIIKGPVMLVVPDKVVAPDKVVVPDKPVVELADNVVKAPVDAEEAPMVVPFIEPPVIATALAFCVDIDPSEPATFCTNAVVAI